MSFLSAAKARFARYGVPEATISSMTRTIVAALDVDQRPVEQHLELAQEPLRLLPASVLRPRVSLNEEGHCLAQSRARSFLNVIEYAQLRIANDLARFSARLGQRDRGIRSDRHALLTTVDSDDHKPCLAPSRRHPHAEALQHRVPHVHALGTGCLQMFNDLRGELPSHASK